jgi:hypothetical protein
MRMTAVLFMTVLSLSGCDLGPIVSAEPSWRPIDLTPAQLAGTWRNESRDGTLILTADGGFRVRNFPPDELETMDDLTPAFDQTRDRIDDQGRWTFTPDPGQVYRGRHVDVTLHLEPTEFIEGKTALSLEGQWFGDRLGLVLYFGDPDLNDTYAYLKVVGSTVSPS